MPQIENFSKFVAHIIKITDIYKYLTQTSHLMFMKQPEAACFSDTLARPLTDQQKVSREKLAYIIDSTSAPVCSICPLSSQGAYIVALFAMILPATTAPLNQFICAIPYNFYAIFALVVVFLSAAHNINIGKMNDLASIQKVMPWEEGDDEEEAHQLKGKEQSSDLGIPILLLVSISMTMMYITGFMGNIQFGLPLRECETGQVRLWHCFLHGF